MNMFIFKALSIIGYILILIIPAPLFFIWELLSTPFTPKTVQDVTRWMYRDIRSMTKHLISFLKSTLKEGKNPKLSLENCIDAFFISID